MTRLSMPSVGCVAFALGFMSARNIEKSDPMTGETRWHSNVLFLQAQKRRSTVSFKQASTFAIVQVFTVDWHLFMYIVMSKSSDKVDFMRSQELVFVQDMR